MKRCAYRNIDLLRRGPKRSTESTEECKQIEIANINDANIYIYFFNFTEC